MEFAPVILFVYHRYDHLKQTLQALDHNQYADQSILYIFSDGYKNDEDRKAVEDVRKLLYQYREVSSFKKVVIEESSDNKGLAASVISGVTQIMQMYDRVIVLEDDLISSTDFLKYMNETLAFYENDNRIWSIAGYTPDIKILKKYTQDVYMCPRFGSWGWATWRNRWDLIDWQVSDYNSFARDKKQRRAFDRCGAGLTQMLDRQMQGVIDSWAVRFCYEQFKHDGWTVNPRVSRIENIGTDGSGSHMENNSKWTTKLNAENKDIICIPFQRNKALERAYFNFFAGNLPYRCYKRLRSFAFKCVKRITT